MASPRVQPLRRALAATAATVLLATGAAVLPAAPAAAAPASTDAAEAAGHWLTSQLTDGKFFPGPLGPDTGLTIDMIYALAATGVGKDQATIIKDWLLEPGIIDGYTFNFGLGVLAGAGGKVMLALQILGENPNDVGGVDLEAELRKVLLAAPDPHAGLFENHDLDEHANAFDDSMVVLALSRTSAGVPGAAIDFLLGTQCANGSFVLFYDIGCQADAAHPDTGSVDATAMVLQALLAANLPAASAAAADKAIAWLINTQQDPATGAFGDGSLIGANTNSSGLAGQALRAFGRTTEADKAAAYILGLQLGCAGPEPNRGAIQYNDKGFGSGDVPRATAQAMLALGGGPLGAIDIKGAKAGLAPFDCTPPPPVAAPTMPDTGSPTGLIVAVGAVVLLLGVALTIAARRRRHA